MMMFACCLLPFGGVNLGNANFLTTAFLRGLAFFTGQQAFFFFFFAIFPYKPAHELVMDSEAAMKVGFLSSLLFFSPINYWQ